MTDKLENSVSYFPLNNPENVLILIRFFLHICTNFYSDFQNLCCIKRRRANESESAT